MNQANNHHIRCGLVSGMMIVAVVVLGIGLPAEGQEKAREVGTDNKAFLQTYRAQSKQRLDAARKAIQSLARCQNLRPIVQKARSIVSIMQRNDDLIQRLGSRSVLPADRNTLRQGQSRAARELQQLQKMVAGLNSNQHSCLASRKLSTGKKDSIDSDLEDIRADITETKEEFRKLYQILKEAQEQRTQASRQLGS